MIMTLMALSEISAVPSNIVKCHHAHQAPTFGSILYLLGFGAGIGL